jgi:DNA repair exonuclease SbcCD nuclease subunit
MKLSKSQYLAMIKPKSKYRATRCTYYGLKFASKAERDYYRILKHLQQKGEIDIILLQVPFYLPGSTKFVADFLVISKKKNAVEVHEVKGLETPAWKIKKRLFLEAFPEFKLVVVKPDEIKKMLREYSLGEI